jgi:hypothetical protein
MFNGVPDNLVFCSNNETNIPNILGELKNKRCSINDCSGNWKNNKKIFIEETVTCVSE